MRPHSRLKNPRHGSLVNSLNNGRGSNGGAAISARHRLLGSSWTADVEALESAIGRFQTDGNLTNKCDVSFFEIAGDGHLHVNVTHRYATKGVRGWAGPGSLPNGFVYNRRFGDTPPQEIIRHIRDMVFASPI
jgi:hypothetical protein